MTSKSFNHTVSAALLGLTFLTASSVTNAGDHELWREQVQKTPSEPTTLTASIRQGTTSDYRLWREPPDLSVVFFGLARQSGFHPKYMILQ